MTVTVTRNLPDRFHGFLKSCMHEVAPGVYVIPKMKESVRERIWRIMLSWNELIPEDGGIIMLWQNKMAPSGMGSRVLGWPKKELIEYEGIWLTYKPLLQQHDINELKKLCFITDPSFDSKDPLIDL